MAQKKSNNNKSRKSKNERIKDLEKKIKVIEKNMFNISEQLSERNDALLRKLTVVEK
jgi:hypothetical protein